VNTYGSVERRIGGFPLPEEKRERERREIRKKFIEYSTGTLLIILGLCASHG